MFENVVEVVFFSIASTLSISSCSGMVFMLVLSGAFSVV